MSDEEIKAIQEVAKATSKAIDAGEKLGVFFSRVFGEPIETAVGMLQDKLTVIRWERQLRLADRVQEILRKRGVEATIAPVSPRLALPIIEKASIETDDYLQDLWAHLLASSMDPSKTSSVRGAFVGIIQEIEVVDAKILEYVFSRFRAYSLRQGKSVLEVSPEKSNVHKKQVLSALGLSDGVYHLAIDNLMRLRLLASYSEDTFIETEDDSVEASLIYGYERVCITPLGISFVLICTPTTDLESDEALLGRLHKETAASEVARKSALKAALSQIEAQFGRGTILRAKNDADA